MHSIEAERSARELDLYLGRPPAVLPALTGPLIGYVVYNEKTRQVEFHGLEDQKGRHYEGNNSRPKTD